MKMKFEIYVGFNKKKMGFIIAGILVTIPVQKWLYVKD